MEPLSHREPLVVRTGRWLTKRRGVLLAPLFASTLLAARYAPDPRLEWIGDLGGFLCLIAGTWLRLLAASYHESSHRSEPITAGPYAWIRHPLYVANFLLGLGIVLLAGWWPMIAVYTFSFLIIHTAIARSEEIHIANLYGEKYLSYCRAVHAFLPWRRYRAPRYGSRGDFKLQKGKERLKAASYFLSAILVLLFKRLHHFLQVFIPRSLLRPLPHTVVVVAGALALLGVVLRPRTRSPWLRASQTGVVISSMLLLAIHLPGVWPGGISVPVSQVRVITLQETPPVFAMETHPRPVEPKIRPSFSLGQLWNHLELLGGASAFGIATLVEREREGKNYELNHELNEAGQAALLATGVLSLWKQWRSHTPARALPSPGEESWRFRVSPALDETQVALMATWKRRF